MPKKRNPTKCVNCRETVWLGAFFAGPFLCEDCQGRAASIILRLKKRLTKRAADKCCLCGKKSGKAHICGSCLDEIL